MRIPVSVALLAAFAFPTLAAAQDDREQIIAAVRRTFDAMHAKDTASFRAVFHPSARIVITGTGPNGEVRANPVSIDAFVQNIARLTQTVEERFYEPEVRIDGNLATVWTRYAFYASDNFSHCGFDSFQMAKLNGSWKVVQIADTQRRDAARCGHGEGSTPITAPAPTAADSAAVLAAMQKFFDALGARDTVAMKDVLHPAARTSVVGGEVLRAASMSESMTAIANQPANPSERAVKPEIRIHDNLATIWTWYDFHHGEQFSHCGYDAFQLVRGDSSWKILHISYTVRRTGCAQP